MIYGIEYNEIEFDEKFRNDLMKKAETEEGLQLLYEEAKKIDPIAVEKISNNDKKRIIRILEIFHSTGKTKTELDQFLSKLTGKPIKTIRKLTGKDTYMNAKEALQYGLVDKIANAEELNSLLTGGIAVW